MGRKETQKEKRAEQIDDELFYPLGSGSKRKCVFVWEREDRRDEERESVRERYIGRKKTQKISDRTNR